MPFLQTLLITWTLWGGPPAHDPTVRVHDFAGILLPDQKQELESICQNAEKQTTAQIAVVTVPSLEGQSVEEYAFDLFNDWGIGRKGRNNGVLFLVAPNDRRMRIEVGYGLEPLLTDELCGQIRDESILPSFRVGDYATGITQGTRRLAAVLLDHQEAARGVEGSGPFFLRRKEDEALAAMVLAGGVALALFPLGWWMARKRQFSKVTFAFLIVVVLALVLVAGYLFLRVPMARRPWAALGGGVAAAVGSLFFNWRKYRRFGPRNCSKCGTRLELLSEQDDDPKLTEVQRLEEKIGSVDYDVWFCPACLHTNTEQYIKYFSNFQPCPKCHARTFKEGPQNVVRAATYSSAGYATVEGRCVSCNAKRVRKVVLPMLVESSSSSGSSFGGGGGGGGGGSFGGGSSGGGGASGSW